MIMKMNQFHQTSNILTVYGFIACIVQGLYYMRCSDMVFTRFREVKRGGLEAEILRRASFLGISTNRHG
ncbi:hypothetical protein ES288_A13G156800v1 [Gossypium darwinii]|uniref:Uncharacterized protein n=1 Tax=Gossypium darwinii TaxID=34276 RepID=A0A5D2DZX0_GOSDA|nr:hypothetical protein ES288_A13G156800v1 [Gossypium darwinii]